MTGAVEQALTLLVADFDAALAHMTKQLGLRIDRISPADDPREADVSGAGMQMVLRRDADGVVDVSTLTLEALKDAKEGGALPPGALVEPVVTGRSMRLPDGFSSLQVSRLAESADFAAGRAGMGYRDLIPDRQGGRFIASHIRIDGGGEVPDYAHFHKIRFQMIYCYRGWVRVVYEDQGEPFILHAGDCVLQPPEIRHRVLESSPGLEVIEIGCPAEHDTYADHDITLPTGVVAPDRDFGGQRFVRHVAADAIWMPWSADGFECRHVGIAVATDGLAGVRVVRPTEADAAVDRTHDAEFMMLFLLDGSMTVTVGGATHHLGSGDSITLPGDTSYNLAVSAHSELLEITLPADVPYR